jgi:hypothetical protein
MRNKKLAELIDRQLRSRLLPDDDIRKYDDQKWFIDMIVALLNKYPHLSLKLNPEESSLEEIIFEIEQYFKKLRESRDLDIAFIRNFIEIHEECRKLESMVMLLLIGLTFINTFKRLSNNQKNEEEVLELESTLDNVTSVIFYADLMPKQQKREDISIVYKLLGNNDVAGDVINNKIEYVSITAEFEKIFRSTKSFNNRK